MVECYTLAIDCLQNPCHYSITKLVVIILEIIFQLTKNKNSQYYENDNQDDNSRNNDWVLYCGRCRPQG